MALSRLFVAEAELHLRHGGFARRRRWSTSSPLPPSPSKYSPKASKKASASREKKVEAINSFVERYMQTHPGVFPKAKEVHNEVGGSWYILRDILTETKSKMLPYSRSDKHTATESHVTVLSTSDAIGMKANTDTGKLARPENGKLKAMLGAAESHMIPDKDSGVLASMEVTDNADLVGPKYRQHPIGSPTTAGTVLDSKLSGSDNKNVEGQVTGGSTSETHSFEAKLNEGARCTSEGNPTKAYCSAQAQDSRAVEIGAFHKKVLRLVDFFKRTVEKAELNSKKINTLKQETLLDPKEDYKCFASFDVSERSQEDSKYDIRNAESSQQDKPSNPNDTHGMNSERRSQVKGLVDCLLTLSKDPQKNPSNGQYDKMDRINRELRGGVNRGSMHEALKFLSLKEEDRSVGQLEKIEGNKANSDIELKCKEASTFSLAIGNLREPEEFIGGENGKEKLQLNKEEMTVKLPLVTSQQLMSDDSDSDVAAIDYPRVALGDEVLVMNKGVRLNTSPYEETNNGKNCILVKFLPKAVKVSEVALALGDCGPIAEIRIIPSRRENKFNYAYVYFKTEEGLRKALSKSDTTVGGADVVLEPASPTKIKNCLFALEPFSNEDFPAAFLKNPTRSVMIKGLSDNISFHHLKCALSCWGRISGFAMGSVSWNVYVEFESEESKDRALSEAAISVLGRKLSILRVDAPNTTVVRISNVNPQSGPAKVCSICDSYGRVKRVVSRDINTFDVHFKLFEWPNMVKILNRMNGLVVDQHQWIAQPATIIPAEVLQAIWMKPEGQKVVYDLIRNLCRRIEEKRIDTNPMLALAQQYYREIVQSEF